MPKLGELGRGNRGLRGASREGLASPRSPLRSAHTASCMSYGPGAFSSGSVCIRLRSTPPRCDLLSDIHRIDGVAGLGGLYKIGALFMSECSPHARNHPSTTFVKLTNVVHPFSFLTAYSGYIASSSSCTFYTFFKCEIGVGG